MVNKETIVEIIQDELPGHFDPYQGAEDFVWVLDGCAQRGYSEPTTVQYLAWALKPDAHEDVGQATHTAIQILNEISPEPQDEH